MVVAAAVSASAAASRRWASTSVAAALDMFALCMSRGPTHLPDYNNHTTNKQVKGGYLLRYKRGWLCRSWIEEWVVLYEDSTIAWFADKGLSRPRGRIRLTEAPELLAVGEWTRQVPKRPRVPRSCHVGQLLAIGSRNQHSVHWLMAQSPAEVNDWMTAISNTLPPPPHFTLQDKRYPQTCRSPPRSVEPHSGQLVPHHQHGVDGQQQQRDRQHSNEHTVTPGVVIDWGHGWGWGQAAWAAQMACAHDSSTNTAALYCSNVEEYTLGGYEDVDYSACADFMF